LLALFLPFGECYFLPSLPRHRKYPVSSSMLKLIAQHWRKCFLFYRRRYCPLLPRRTRIGQAARTKENISALCKLPHFLNRCV
jgi:hypothetical protein